MNTHFAEKALKTTTVLTFFVAGFEMFRCCLNFKEGMNLLDVASFVSADMGMFCFIFIFGNLVLLPSAVMLYKQSGISLKDEIYDKNTLGTDVLIGIVLAILSSLVSLVFSFTSMGRTSLAYSGTRDAAVGTILLQIVALVFVSGICKEIFYRGFAKNFCGSIFGELPALLLFNLMFGLLDWYNMGASFVSGLLWIWGYRKRKHLIVPMIAHGGANLIGIIFNVLTAGIYLRFRERYPDLAGRVAQQYIATYLGITPESLSRIRKALREETE